MKIILSIAVFLSIFCSSCVRVVPERIVDRKKPISANNSERKNGYGTNVLDTVVENIKEESVEITESQNPLIEIETKYGNMVCELYEDYSPNTVANMVRLTENKFYQGMSFHRIINGFMAQGGCPNTRENAHGFAGTGGPGYSFNCETTNGLKHDTRGILSMANSGANTNGSQFFICFTKTPHLNGKHTVFGKVISGFDVLDELEEIGSPTGKTKEKIYFSINLLRKKSHKYNVIKN